MLFRLHCWRGADPRLGTQCLHLFVPVVIYLWGVCLSHLNVTFTRTDTLSPGGMTLGEVGERIRFSPVPLGGPLPRLVTAAAPTQASNPRRPRGHRGRGLSPPPEHLGSQRRAAFFFPGVTSLFVRSWPPAGNNKMNKSITSASLSPHFSVIS